MGAERLSTVQFAASCIVFFKVKPVSWSAVDVLCVLLAVHAMSP